MHTHALPYTNMAGKKGFEGDILSLNNNRSDSSKQLRGNTEKNCFFRLHFHYLQDLLACLGKRNRIFIVNLSCIPIHMLQMR